MTKSKAITEEKVKEAPKERKRTPRKVATTSRSPMPKEERQQRILRNLREEEFYGFYDELFSQKARLRRKHLIIAEIKRLLDQNIFLSWNYTDTFHYATKIFKALPELEVSRDSYERIIRRRLGLIINSPLLMQSVIKLKFDSAYIRHLVSRDLIGLKDIEERLQEEELADLNLRNIVQSISPEYSSLGISEAEEEENIYEDVKIKKKPKKVFEPKKPIVQERKPSVDKKPREQLPKKANKKG